MAFETITYLNEKGELASDCPIKIHPDELIDAYKIMAPTRLVDERMINLQR